MSNDVAKYERRLLREKTARKEAERLLEEKSLELYTSSLSLQLLNDQLESKVVVRTQDLVKARDAALSLAKVKSDFLSNMSHELRTPMNGVLGALSLLLDSPINKSQSKLVNTGIYSGKLLLQLINDILDLSKLDAGKLTLESVSFNPVTLLENAIDSFALSGQTKQLKMESDIATDMPYQLIGDPLRVQQIVTNLLSNAVKFTEQGSVHLQSFYAKGLWHIAIKDTGVGMSEAQQKTIFEEFTQADLSTTRNFGGTGLGLNISQKLLNMMHGKIKLSSSIGQGSTFQIDIPIAADATVIKPEQSLRDYLQEVVLIDQTSQESDFIQSCLTHWQVAVIHKFHNFADFQNEQLSLNEDVLFIVSVDIFKSLSNAQLDMFSDNKFILLTNNYHDYQDLPHVSFPVKQSELFEKVAHLIGFNATKLSPIKAKKTNYKFKQQLILLVEDNQVNQQIAQLLLSKVNLKVLIAKDGQEALDMVQKHSFELILMDIQMPVMDGLTATKAIRAMPGSYASIPILAMTANCFLTEVEEMKAVGMNSHIGKPIVPELLYAEIAKHLNTDD